MNLKMPLKNYDNEFIGFLEERYKEIQTLYNSRNQPNNRDLIYLTNQSYLLGSLQEIRFWIEFLTATKH